MVEGIFGGCWKQTKAVILLVNSMSLLTTFERLLSLLSVGVVKMAVNEGNLIFSRLYRHGIIIGLCMHVCPDTPLT